MGSCTEITVTGRHTFTIYRDNGKLKDGLKRSFIVTEDLEYDQQTFVTLDGSRFHIYYEQDVQEQFKYALTVKCIISFQIYTDGEVFCVARLWKEQAAKQPHWKQQRQNRT